MPIGKRWTGAASAASSLLVAATLLVPLAGVAAADPTSETSATMPPRPTTETGDPQAPAAPTSTMPARPTTDVAPGTSDRFSRLAVTPFGCSSYWNPGFNRSFTVCGRILDKYNEFGGPGGKLGLPTSDELVNPDNVGRRTSFQNDASIYWSPTTDAHQLGGEIGKKWCELGCESVLGYPTSDELVNPDNVGRRNSFQNDVSIYWSPATGAHSIGGAIGAEWAARGYEGGPHGYPATDELRNGDGVGRRNIFQGGSIYYHPATGAHTIWGAIRDNWASRSYENGRFGYPTSNEFAFEGGWAQNFQNATIDWLPGDPITPADEALPPDSEWTEYRPTSPVDPRARVNPETTLPSSAVPSSAPSSPDVSVPEDSSEASVPETSQESTTATPAVTSGPEATTDSTADNFFGPRNASAPQRMQEPELPCGFGKMDRPHASQSKSPLGGLAFPEQIHNKVASQCLSVAVSPEHSLKAKTSRLRFWGRPFPQKQIPYGNKIITAGGYQAEMHSLNGSKLTLLSSIACKAGTKFRYHTEFSGTFAFPGEAPRNYGTKTATNPEGKEVLCVGN